MLSAWDLEDSQEGEVTGMVSWHAKCVEEWQGSSQWSKSLHPCMDVTAADGNHNTIAQPLNHCLKWSTVSCVKLLELGLHPHVLLLGSAAQTSGRTRGEFNIVAGIVTRHPCRRQTCPCHEMR